MKKAFTLAEIMIVLTVIGVLTAILLPSAINSAPDENIMKFKKANSTLGTVIRELVNSDRYYSNGDLGIRADGTIINGEHEGDTTYFCETFADTLSIKTKNCSDKNINVQNDAILNIYDGVYHDFNDALKIADNACKKTAVSIGAEVTTSDGIVYFQTAPNFTYGVKWTKILDLVGADDCTKGDNSEMESCKVGRLFSSPDKIWHADKNGFDRVYKIFCIDVDGIPSNATVDDCVNECPFGYGIRADGKILPGARADEWINKSVQNKE